MNEPTMNTSPQTTESVSSLKLHNTKPQKTAQDWVRDMRMSAAVNKSNTGVETDQVTPELMLATSKKLLGISKREQEPDAKDSLAFQRFYGPEMLFQERILRDGGKLARNILWKATNRGNLDFMPVNALEKHISSVFYDSKLAQMMDGSSPLETIDAAYKTTRIGEGGVSSMDSAPDEMRTVQPSYFGFIDPVRSPESFRVGLDVYMTKNVMKGTDGKLYQKFIDAKTGKEVLLDSETAANSVIAAPEMRNAKTKSIFALGGPTGVRIVPRDSVQYYLPRADEAYSTSSNLVTMLSGVKEMRLQMGCLHPDTQVLTIDKKNLINIDKAQVTAIGRIPGSTKDGESKVFDIRTTVAKFPPKRNWFYKIVLRSGRSLITSADHRWSVLRKGQYQLIPANKLKPGDQALRTTFKDVISRRTFVNGIQVNKDIAKVFGYIARSLAQPDNEKLRITIPESEYSNVMRQLSRLGYTEGFNTYYVNYAFCIGIRDPKLKAFLIDAFGPDDRSRKLPSFILSANAAIVAAFLDGYTSDPTKVGRDSVDDIWILELPNQRMRDSIAFLFARIETDTLYRDCVEDGVMHLALKLVPMEPAYGDMLLDDIKVVKKGIPGPIMIDIDVNDNLYATANGIVTHNSKYPLQAISVQSREAPLVRGLDEASGKDMHSLIGKYLGARFAPQDGIVTAVRKDRIDVQYADGSKGSVDLYVNFPMNAKGFINNKPQVKAGQAFKKGDCLASSNYTDDKGVAALGTNLRSAWMSWKGGTYEDAIVISESAAKKLTSDTMYKTAVDLDKTVKLGKKNYLTWKPGEFTKEQMEALDDNGIVKPGTVLHKEDPMILAVRMTEPSPGTMGKRILTDMSERWEHDHPGVVTDVVKTRNGIKVYATVTAPVEIGDKLSGGYGNKGTVAQIIPDDQMPRDKSGRPIDIILSPLGLISRCYDEQTEFLTESGWKFGRDVKDDDRLYCYNRETATWDWGEQLQPFYRNWYEGTMYGYENDAVDFAVTSRHKFWCACDYPGAHWNEKFVEEIAGKKYHVPCVALRRHTQPEATPFELPTIPIKEKDTHTTNERRAFDPYDWAEFLGWYMAEGNTDYDEKTCAYRVHISQFDTVNSDKVERIAALLDRLGLHWCYGRHNKQFHIADKRLAAYMFQFGHAWEKFIPDWLFKQPDGVIRRFIEAIWCGDGNVTETGRFTKDGRAIKHSKIQLTSEKMIDQLQILHAMLGIPSTKANVPPDRRYEHAKPMYRLGVSTVPKTTRSLKGDQWKQYEYSGMTYCPTVSTGYILTRRNGKLLIASNTNNSQLYEGLLGKVAAKTGKPITVPQFMEGSFSEYVADQLKQNGLKPDETLIDPETGREMKEIITGNSYIYKLKHLAESKLSARGTSSYDAEELPGGKGMDGCFPGDQIVAVRNGWRTIRSIASSLNSDYVTSCGDDRKPRYFRAIDRFKKVVPAEDIITITPSWSFDNMGYYRKKVYTMSPTKNHAIYMYDMTQKHAGDLKVGDKLAGMGIRPSDDQMQVIANFLSMPGIVEDDVFTVAVGADHAKLLYFKYKMLRSLGAKLDKENNILSLPNYALYNAAITEADFGELAVCLHQLDSDATCAIDGKVSQLIAKWLPSRYIPDTKPELKEFVKKSQVINPPMELNMQPAMGVMPTIVAKIEQYKTDKSSVTVYDLTIENTHKYVLKGGFLVSNSKRFGTLEQSALAGHGVFEGIIKDAKYIRGQANSDFWRSIRTGDIPTIPGEPLVHKKFFSHLTGAGINVKKTPQGVSIFALTNKDVNELAGPRELRNRDTYEAKNFRPIDGGLFGQDIFGINGDKWGYIQLDSPVPNPVMEEPLARLLGIPEKKFADVAAGKEEINGIKGGASMKAALEKINLDAESAKALNNFKTATPSGKDKMLKRYIAIERMRRAGVKPSEYMLDKIPVIPPIYRPISAYNGLTMVADSNYLYAQLMDARDDAGEAKDLPAEYQQQAEENIYNKWKELTGMYAPQDVKLQSKHVQGLLKWALGSGSPKFSGFSRKVLSTTVDTVGRGVITPDPRLKLNEVGLPEVMAFNILAPIVTRKLVKEGYTPIQAMEKVKKRDVQARDALNEVMKDHPVLINRAPTLHKLSIIGLNPRLVTGNAIRINPSIVSTLAADFDGDANIGRVCILITSEFLDFVKKVSENPEFDLTFCQRVLHYMYGQFRQPLAKGETSMAFHDTKTLISAIEANGTRAVVMDIDLADMPHGMLSSKNSGEKQNIDFYEAAPGIKVLSYDEKTGKLVWADVAYWSEHHNLPVEIVHLAGNRDIITDDDPRAVYGIAQDADTLIPQRFTPTEAQRHNVIVPCMRAGLPWVEPENTLWYVRESDGATSTEQFDDTCYELNFEFGQLLGILAGDGWWDKKDYDMQAIFGGASAIRVSDNDGYNAGYTSMVLGELFGEVAEYTKAFKKEDHPDRYGDTVRYSYHHPRFSTFNPLLTELLGGVGDEQTTGSGNKHLPTWFLATSEDFRRGLFCGLIATDGSISVSHSKGKGQLMVNFCSTSLRLCRELKSLCWSLGLRATISFSKVTTRNNKAWVVNISTYDLKKHGYIFDGMCNERKLQVFNDTDVKLDAMYSKGDYCPFPKCISDVIFKWLKCPNIEKSARTRVDDPEVIERKRIATLYSNTRKYSGKGYITRLGAEQLEAYADECIQRRIWAMRMIKDAALMLDEDEHAKLDDDWKIIMWDALHIMKDQIPDDVYSNAKTLVTRRANIGTGCESLAEAIWGVHSLGLVAEYGLSEEPLFQEWVALWSDGDCTWLPIESVEKTGQIETGYDLTVPGYETFVSSEGVVLSNTVNIHAPVSDKAREEAYVKMMPERNLIGMRDRKILYKPEKEYQQGLYIATRMKSGPDVRTRYFNTLEEARQAYRDGLIDVDDPIVIKDN